MASNYSSEVARNVPATKTPTACDIAWMAGIYEGEGCVSGIKGRTISSIHQKDPEILYRIRELFGGSITEIRKGTRFNCHVWKLYGDVARAMFQAIYPYLSTRRRMQVEKANGLKFTGMPCYRDMKISDERKAKRGSMTNSQKMVESQIAYREKNREKVTVYQRQYAAAKRLQRRNEMQSQVIQ
jgi:hypothetical protein